MLLIGASDDSLWDTVKYINRIKERLKNKEHNCEDEYAIYEYGTHFIFPQRLLKTMLPIGSNLFLKMAFVSARKHPKECKETRMDIDYRVSKIIKSWKNA